MAYLGEEIKKLGFGLMRLPMKGEAIDVEQTKAMVDRFMEEGFTYFDTAWAYAGSEDAIRQALVERYPRESFQLATKNAAWINCKTREEAIAQFETSLKQTGAGYFDFYLLHSLDEHRTKFFDDFDMWSFVKEKKEHLWLHVYEKNGAAVRFYRREKFRITCEGTDQNTGEKESIMVWDRTKEAEG